MMMMMVMMMMMMLIMMMLMMRIMRMMMMIRIMRMTMMLMMMIMMMLRITMTRMLSIQGCLFPLFPKVALNLCEFTECPPPLNSASFNLHTGLRWFSLGLRRHSTSPCTVHFAHMPVLVLQRSMSAKNERAMSAVKSLALC